MRDLMGASPADAGEPPKVRTGGLSNSLETDLTANGINLSMDDYAQNLDPYFARGGKHPFVEKGLDKALKKILKPS